MVALILAAGEGKRLRPFNDGQPKPMIDIGGKPVLQYNIELLAAAEIHDVIINLHYHPESITSYFGSGTRFGVRIRYSFEPSLLGTAGAAENVSEYLRDGDFLVIYGDNLSTIDLRKLIGVHTSNNASFTMALFERRGTARFSGVADVDERGRVRRFREKPETDEGTSHLVNAGYYVVAPHVLGAIPKTMPSDFARDIVPALIEAGRPVFGYRMTEQLWWIDSVPDYERTCKEFEASR